MAVCCQYLTVGALSSRSALSVLVGALFKKVRSLFEHASYIQVSILAQRHAGLCRVHKAYFSDLFILFDDSVRGSGCIVSTD